MTVLCIFFINFHSLRLQCETVQARVKRPLKIGKTKILMTNGSLMKVESIAEYAPFEAFCKIFDLH